MDDDPKIVTLTRTYLEGEGFLVVTVANGRAALPGDYGVGAKADQRRSQIERAYAELVSLSSKSFDPWPGYHYLCI
jgi:hypothetical protein